MAIALERGRLKRNLPWARLVSLTKGRDCRCRYHRGERYSQHHLGRLCGRSSDWTSVGCVACCARFLRGGAVGGLVGKPLTVMIGLPPTQNPPLRQQAQRAHHAMICASACPPATRTDPGVLLDGVELDGPWSRRPSLLCLPLPCFGKPGSCGCGGCGAGFRFGRRDLRETFLIESAYLGRGASSRRSERGSSCLPLNQGGTGLAAQLRPPWDLITISSPPRGPQPA